MGNNHYLMRSIQQTGAGKGQGARRLALVGVEVVCRQDRQSRRCRDVEEPGGRQRRDASTRVVDHFGVTPRQIITSVAQAVDELKLPHSVHIHANNLGLPGNWTTTLETMKLLEGHRGHLTHIQFHSYGGGAGDEDTFSSQVAAAGRAMSTLTPT